MVRLKGRVGEILRCGMLMGGTYGGQKRGKERGEDGGAL